MPLYDNTSPSCSGDGVPFVSRSTLRPTRAQHQPETGESRRGAGYGDGETRTRTRDTTIFSRAVAALERRRKACKYQRSTSTRVRDERSQIPDDSSRFGRRYAPRLPLRRPAARQHRMARAPLAAGVSQVWSSSVRFRRGAPAPKRHALVERRESRHRLRAQSDVRDRSRPRARARPCGGSVARGCSCGAPTAAPRARRARRA
jgi:hypothetical protein